MSFRTALTGLNAASADLGVISNNIANNNTTGFKASRAEFGDIYSLSDLGTSTRRSIGTGVRLNAVSQQFKQGNLETTSNPLDMAIDGEGFFVLADTDGAMLYTRAGAFSLDKDGYVVNSLGQKLQGYQTNPTTGLIDIGTEGDLRTQTANIDPEQTTTGEYGINLDSGDTALDPASFDFNDSRTYNFASAMTIFDSLGNDHSLTAYFVRDENALSSTSTSTPTGSQYLIPTPPGGTAAWQVFFSMDGLGLDGNALPPAGTATPSGTLCFDAFGALTGTLDPAGADTGTSSISLTSIVPTNGPDPITGNGSANGSESPINTMGVPPGVTLKFDTATQFGSASSTNQVTQDGYATGRVVGVDVGEDGSLYGRYSNGQAKVLGQVILANFRNVQGLSPIGDSSWVETSASGQPVKGPPGTASLGLVRAGALELSNVELSEQLVKMINAQRNFQANAQVISTSDEMTQTLLQLR
ncbi:MAG: flagellar hook protein FlgE [Candidatus Competibacter sp.]|nr:flagellar hook protein FlgE [Candidatus Competibacter sp.]